MRNRIILFLASIAMALLFTTACNDEDDPSFAEADLTTSSGWHLESMDTNLDEKVEAALEQIDTLTQEEKDQALQFIELIAYDIETVEDCESDDTYIFAQSGELMFMAGNINCNNNEDDDSFIKQPTTWEMNGNTLTITDGDGDTNDAEIKTLNESELVFEVEDEGSSDDFNIEVIDNFYIEVTMTAAN